MSCWKNRLASFSSSAPLSLHAFQCVIPLELLIASHPRIPHQSGKEKQKTCLTYWYKSPPGAYSRAMPKCVGVRNTSLKSTTCGWQKLLCARISRATCLVTCSCPRGKNLMATSSPVFLEEPTPACYDCPRDSGFSSNPAGSWRLTCSWPVALHQTPPLPALIAYHTCGGQRAAPHSYAWQLQNARQDKISAL